MRRSDVLPMPNCKPHHQRIFIIIKKVQNGREIIRQGDPTSHGGTALEGSLTDICMGKPIAYIGHKVFCPLCKGTYPIIEGVLTTTLFGRGRGGSRHENGMRCCAGSDAVLRYDRMEQRGRAWAGYGSSNCQRDCSCRAA